LAKISKIDQGTISRFERGGDFRFRVFKAICKALDCTIRDVYLQLANVDSCAMVVAESNASYCKDTDPVHIALHQMLSMILHSEEEAWKVGITQNLKAMSLAARSNLPSELDYFLFSPNVDPLPGDKKRFYNDTQIEKGHRRRRE